MPPSGARIFYFTRLALLRQNPSAIIEPDAQIIEDALAQRFLDLAPSIARRLAADYKHAIRLLKPNQTPVEARRFLSNHALLTAPPLTWAPEHLAGIYEPLRQRWQALWRACWRQAGQEHLARLLPILNADLLLVTPVAPPVMKGRAALKKLRQQLAQDKETRASQMPPPAAYTYDEPLEDWLLRPLLSGQWLFRLCRALAELTRAVPELARQRAAAQGVQDTPRATWQQQAGTLKQAVLRTIPAPPQASVTAEAIFYYTVSAFRAAAGEAGDEPILPDARLLAPAQFRALLALAVQVTERLLWDETLALRALPTHAPERRQLLRQALLSPRLKRHYDALARKERWRRERAQAAPLPPFVEWETPLQAALDAQNARLAASIAPAAITSERLDDLLRAPRAALAGQYLYQSSLADWIQEALPAHLPGGDALWRFCQRLAGALGEWPPNVPGAPATTEQAGHAVCWYCKLALEARIDGVPGSPSSHSATSARDQPPRRQDGVLVVWLGTPLPPAALELATVIAPLVARVMYEDACKAASEQQPLFAARLQAGEPESVAEITRQLQRRAAFLALPNAHDAVLEAWDKLSLQLERLVLPADISFSLLSGNIDSLDNLTGLDLLKNGWYSINRNSYQYLGSFSAFACSFIRPPRPAALLVDDPPLETQADDEDVQVDSIVTEDQAALQMLDLIVRPARGDFSAGLDLADARLLAQAIFNTNSGRGLVDRFVQQGEPVARELSRLWQTAAPLAQKAQNPILPLTANEKMTQYAALARFLAAPALQRSAEMRRAVGDFFELPMNMEQMEQATRLPLGMLERLTGWATRASLRAEALLALDALGQTPKAQRQAILARLLAQEPIALTLALLEQAGWSRPSWLEPSAPAASPTTEPWASQWLHDAQAQVETPGRSSPQLFLDARQHWHNQLASLDTAHARRARALIAEWLEVHFWGGLLERSEQQHIALFYRTLLDALCPSLRAVMGAAVQVAWKQKLAHLAEVVGLTGCLPPQLPAQLDHPAFFQAMQEQLSAGTAAEESESSAQDAQAELRIVRQQLRAARWRTLAWFLALAGTRTDNERRILLAAMSLAQGNADRLEGWIAGQALSQAEVKALYQQIKRWHHQTSITEENIPGLLHSAAEQVRPVWRQLRRAPAFTKRSG
jgi:hypothetical protein